MKTIIPEIKARIQCLYIGCELFVPDEPKETWYPFDKNEGGLKLVGINGSQLIVQRIAEHKYDLYNQTQLLLTPLQNITDEDAIECVGYLIKLGIGSPAFINPKQYCIEAYNSGGTLFMVYSVVDYLRSRGYALPYMSYSVSDLVELGVFQIREEI